MTIFWSLESSQQQQQLTPEPTAPSTKQQDVSSRLDNNTKYTTMIGSSIMTKEKRHPQLCQLQFFCLQWQQRQLRCLDWTWAMT
jgi:hypothetical protein